MGGFFGGKMITDSLFELQDLKYRDFNSKLIPTVEPDRVIGVRTPDIRALAKELNGSVEAEDFLKKLPHFYYEENNLHAFLLEKIKDYSQLIKRLDSFLPYVDNWATCDSMKPPIFKKNKDKLIVDIMRWLKSGDTYTVRYALNMLMTHFLDGEDFKEEYLSLAAGVKSDEYYINMMIAWYFATALAKQRDCAMKYITGYRLSAWVHNKTIQKSVESFRISNEDKDFLKTLRIKKDR